MFTNPDPNNMTHAPYQQGYQQGVLGVASNSPQIRRTGLETLQDLRWSYQRDAEALQIILNMLPSELSPEQDAALYRVFGPT